MSDKQLSLHYAAHAGYVRRVNERIQHTRLQGASLDQVIMSAVRDDDLWLAQQAQQAWNHDLFWQSMRPDGGGPPPGKGFPYDQFRRSFIAHANSVFGSGWVWLTQHEDGRLAVEVTTDANYPEGNPLMCLDLWEHAYYVDLPNEREKFVVGFLDHLLNWDFVARNYRS